METGIQYNKHTMQYQPLISRFKSNNDFHVSEYIIFYYIWE